MAIKRFSHFSAQSLQEATAILSRSDGRAKVIAGGTDLLGAMKDGIHAEAPEAIVDLKTIPGLCYIKADGKALRIGALTTLKAIADDPTIRQRYPVLAEAARQVAAPQLRNMGTIAGNLCQEPRCWYYRTPDDQFHCLRKGGHKCGALLGDHRYHSVFGGAKISSPACADSCPTHVDIPAYMALIRRDDLDAAASMILEKNPMPAMTGRICPHTCESSCNRGDYDEPVAIRNAERRIGDHVLDHAKVWMKPPGKESKKSVAIVGAGPGGLSAAYYLRKAGHRVTVFERYPEAGGMLRYAIPGYRLAKDLVRKQIAAYEGMGITFKTGMTIGKKGIALKALRKQFHALLLATGAWRQRSLDIEKADLLTSGMDFLTAIEQGQATEVGANVLVIGGGNVAVDVAISALKLGAKKVAMASLETLETMPAFSEEIEHARREGVAFLHSWGPHRIVAKGGRIRAMELVRCTAVFDKAGRFHPTFDKTEKQVVEADQIILAIGQSAELEYLNASLRSERNLIRAEKGTFATAAEGIFAAGDAVYGPASVVTAIAAGREAAASIDAYLTGRKQAAAKAEGLVPTAMHGEALQRSVRTEDAACEALRCLNCSCIAVNASDLAPALIVLGARIVTTKRTVGAEEFFTVDLKQTTILDPDEIIKAIAIPFRAPMSRQSYLKFRIRNSIDFPIVGLAFVLDVRGKTIAAARLAFSAVAPTPRRLQAVEDFLKGKPADMATADAAGELAVQDAAPQAKNRYKLQVMKALLKKAILAEP
jgi:NADPH-dependent glutamate synthase beta subunit-like oxidoreductase